MVVSSYGVKPGSGEESGELDLKFGRTRALILNQGNEKKDIRIKARAATMGVRGTEIFVDAPKDSAKPIQFFTLEGQAEVKAHDGAPPVPVAQNQGVATSGVAPTASGNSGSSDSKGESKSDSKSSDAKGSDSKGESKSADAKSGDGKGDGKGESKEAAKGGEGGSTKPVAANNATSAEVAPASMSMNEVKNEIKKAGLEPVPVNAGLPPPPPGGAGPRAPGGLDGFALGSLPPMMLDPVIDRNSPLTIAPRFCNASSGTCN